MNYTLPHPLPALWYDTKKTPPVKETHEIFLAMYVNGLTAIPAVVSGYIIATMPDKYPCWRALVPNQDFVKIEVEA